MSRRRPPSNYSFDISKVEIGCTGRGSHKRVLLASAQVFGELGKPVQDFGAPDTLTDPLHIEASMEGFQHISCIEWKVAPEWEFVYLDGAHGSDIDAHRTGPFKCPRCERDMPLREDKAAKTLRALKANGVSFLDLSAMDAIH